MALLNNDKHILPLSSIAELLGAKTRTLKIYEDKGLLPQQEGKPKKVYSINDIKLIAFVYYLASVKKINASGIRYILDMFNNSMSDEAQFEFLDSLEEEMKNLSQIDIKEVDLT